MTTPLDTAEQAPASPPGGSLAQIVIDGVVGHMVIAAEGLPPYVEQIVQSVLRSSAEGGTADTVAGALLGAIGGDPRFAPSLRLATEPHETSSWTVWLRHEYPARWLVASGPDPDHLTSLQWQTANSRAGGD